jgi:hypothetical protein
MAAQHRLTISLDSRLYSRLLKLTDHHRPRLPKRYVVELALDRLVKDVESGAVQLGLQTDAKAER